jgi:ribonuclease Z
MCRPSRWRAAAYGVGFSINHIFFTHFHADHYLGVIGLIRTFGLQGRTDPLHLYGPAGARRVLARAVELGVERAAFAIEIHEVSPGEAVRRRDYAIEVVPVEHGRGALGYVLREDPRLGRFDPEKARALGVPEGPLWGRIHKGDTVEWEEPGADPPVRRSVTPADLVGAPRPGRVVAISGDTRPCRALVEAAAGADLLVHEATFGEEERDRARETLHSTAVEAGQVALAAGVRKLALTHLSARYSATPEILLREAREVFPETVVAKDGMTIDVPFRGDAD